MKLPSYAVDRPVTTFMVVLMVIILGVVSLGRLTIDLFPNMTFPAAVVITTYEGVGPKEIESLVTRPIEEALGTVQNVKNITSSSQMGVSMVVAEFNWGTDMDFASLQMREKVDLYKRMFPSGVDSPMIFKFDPAMMPIMYFGISGDMDQAGLKAFAEDVVKNRLERLEGVASVELSGGLVREIQIVVDHEKLKGYNLSLNQVIQALQAENLNLPGGKVDDGKKELVVRTVGEFTDIDEIKDIVINTSQGISVPLRDIADVRDTFKDVETFARMNGKPSVGISVQKQTDHNTVRVANRINEELKRIQAEHPEVQVYTVFDQSDFIKKVINSLVQNGIMGAFLAVLILLIFLRNFRTTLIISTAIPISVIATFILIHFAGLTLNIMSLGGLALGIGMLVDNSIVVLENIFRFRQEGYSRIDAAKAAAEEVGTAVIASTLTTAAVFLPIVYVEGLASVLFKEMALTVSFSLFASLIVSLTLIPVMSSKILKVSGADEMVKRGIMNRVFILWQNFFDGLTQKYAQLLRWSIRHRKLVLVAAAGAFVLSFAFVPFIGMEFIPKMDEGTFNIEVEMPTGTRLLETDEVFREIEDYLAGIPEVESIFVSGGMTEGMNFSSGSEVGVARVKLVPRAERKRSTNEIIEQVRQRLREIPDVEIKVQAQDSMTGGFGSGAPISIEIKGDDLNRLREIAEEVAYEVSKVEGTREVESSIREGKPEVQVKVNRQKAASLGLSAYQVASTVEAAVQGKVATRYKISGDEIDIRVRLDRDSASTLSDLKQVTITSPAGFQLPLEDVADLVIEEGPRVINRKNQVRLATVTSQIAGRDLGSITRDIQAGLRNLAVPEGYQIEFGGENKEMVEAFMNLLLALVLAVLLVYMILASQFESLLHPFTIMFSVPLAFIGVSLGLFITGRTLNVPSFIGIIMLSGIVVNNAIVLVDYINTLRRRGMDRDEAILKAGPIRLRPILMTALTTILAMFPLALGLGEGAEVRAPMATVVIGGLTFSTLLTLVIVPVIYTVFDDVGKRILPFLRRRLSRKEPRKEGV
ncbi:MAG: efflux RND transporter permease subunit [Firmicutes bacterium]|nr:efflux RND transporter permease subunit [Bacillota bacterium]